MVHQRQHASSEARAKTTRAGARVRQAMARLRTAIREYQTASIAVTAMEKDFEIMRRQLCDATAARDQAQERRCSALGELEDAIRADA